MVTPAMQLASKIPDVHVQLWASALLKGNSHDLLCRPLCIMLLIVAQFEPVLVTP